MLEKLRFSGILLGIVLLLFSCDDNGGHEDLPKLEVDEELKDYFVHEEGTKFVMEDTAENLVDTLVITSSRRNQGTAIQEDGEVEPKYDYWDPSYFNKYEAKSGIAETFENWFATELFTFKRDEKTHNGLDLGKDIRGSFELKRESEWDIKPRDKVSKKDSLDVLGETYYDVLIFETRLNRNIVFGKKIGPLRIDHKEDFLLKEKIEP